MATQLSLTVLALLLSLLIYLHLLSIWHLALIAFAAGSVLAFDIPVRQSFVIEMVGKGDLMNAIALNSMLFNAARIVGPAVGGFIISRFVRGLEVCFLVNGLSYIPLIVGLSMMRLPDSTPALRAGRGWEHIKEGFSAVFASPLARRYILQIAILSLFGWSYTVLLPVFARDILKVGASGQGLMMGLAGVGALVGALVVASLSHSVDRHKLSFAGIVSFCLASILFATSKNFTVSLAALFLCDWGLVSFSTIANTVVQTEVSDSIRGRVMGVYSLSFLGLAPLASLEIGFLAKILSAPSAVVINALCCLAVTILILILSSRWRSPFL